MLRRYSIAMIIGITMSTGLCFADVASTPSPSSAFPVDSATQVATDDNMSGDIKAQLATELSAAAGGSDLSPEAAMKIGELQMQLAKQYLQQNDRSNAIIHAELAKQMLVKATGNPFDPRLIPVYSLLVDIYSSKVDITKPGIDTSDAEKAKTYREIIDHIHAQ